MGQLPDDFIPYVMCTIVRQEKNLVSQLFDLQRCTVSCPPLLVAAGTVLITICFL